MKILVTGSRDWTDREVIYRTLNAVCVENDLMFPPDEYGNTLPDPDKVTIMHGDCPTGADRIADDWCLGNCFGAHRFPANWKMLGKRAGHIRNAAMVACMPDLVLAFQRNHSEGTADCIEQAARAGLVVAILERNDV